MLAEILNANRRYFLDAEVWVRSSSTKRRVVLERYDGAEDSAFFLYFLVPGKFIGRVGERTVARPTKYVEFNKGGYRVKVLRSKLLHALEQLA